jgi:hypothetical protein
MKSRKRLVAATSFSSAPSSVMSLSVAVSALLKPPGFLSSP